MRVFLVVLFSLLLATVVACSPGSGDGDGDVDGDVDGDGDGDGDADADEDACDPAADCCSDSECSDQVYCNGLEVCDRGICQAGMPIDCDDMLECTTDICNEASNTCVHEPVHTECDDGDICTGDERCNPADEDADARGCITGTPIRCDDDDPCTDDYCEEGECRARIRDTDLDGFGDERCLVCWTETDCERGEDCNDADDTVFPGAEEICDDGLDNDCDGTRDYAYELCTIPNDACPGATELPDRTLVHASSRGATASIETACGDPSHRDVAFYFHLAAESDVEIRITGHSSVLTASLTSVCGDAELERGCLSGRSFVMPARALAAGTYFVVVTTSAEVDFSVELTADPATAGPDGDLCSTAPSIAGDGSVHTASLVGTRHDYALGCVPDGDLLDTVFELTVPTEHTADFTVALPSGSGDVALSIQSSCGLASSEVGCWTGDTTIAGRVWRLTPGTYYIIVAHDTETDIEVTATLLPLDPGLYLVENFDGVPSGWTLSGQWSHGTPSGGGPAVDDGPLIGATLTGTYPNSMSFTVDYAETPTINLSGATAPVLEFRGWLDTESCCDGGQVQISVDGGAYTRLEDPGMSPAYGGTYGWRGVMTTWQDYSIPLSTHIGHNIQLRFAIRSDSSVVRQGWYVDSVMVYEP